MKKLMLGVVCALALAGVGATTAQAQDVNFGVGYQSILPGNILDGVSARAWLGMLGLDANLFQATVSTDTQDVKVWLGAGRVMFAPIVKANSKFYVGGEVGFGKLDTGNDSTTLKIFGGFLGSEFMFQEFPELGFNWEVGYRLAKEDVEGAKADLKGVSVSMGIHYYFGGK